jgi:hypothetical protein
MLVTDMMQGRHTSREKIGSKTEGKGSRQLMKCLPESTEKVRETSEAQLDAELREIRGTMTQV